MLTLLRRWILPSTSSPSITGFFSPHYMPALAATTTSHRISHFSTYPPLLSDNKPTGTKPNNKPPPPPASPSTPSSATSPPVQSPAEDSLKPVVSPAWNELMTILWKHAYESHWTPEAQDRYNRILEQYPYVSPETQYSTALPTPATLTAREACQSAAEEALLADYRPLRAGFAEDYTQDPQEEDMDAFITFDFEDGVMRVPMNKTGLAELLKDIAGKDLSSKEVASRMADGLTERAPSFDEKQKMRMELTSTRRKRYTKMKNHKRRKL